MPVEKRQKETEEKPEDERYAAYDCNRNVRCGKVVGT